MPAEVVIALPGLSSFLLALARVSGFVAFAPLPGIQSGPEPARAALAVLITISLIGTWPQPTGSSVSAGHLLMLAAGQFAFGLAAGLALSFVLEALQLAAQMIALQAGYSYASTIDPTTQADSGVLQILGQLFGGFLFFAMGFHRELIRALARSFEVAPLAVALPAESAVNLTLRLGTAAFQAGLRLALPVLALLVSLDIAFAILGKVHAQMQVLSFTFSLKMLAGAAALAGALALFPGVIQGLAAHALRLLNEAAGA
jgi:flagellar biosynthetic protein FliR